MADLLQPRRTLLGGAAAMALAFLGAAPLAADSFYPSPPVFPPPGFAPPVSEPPTRLSSSERERSVPPASPPEPPPYYGYLEAAPDSPDSPRSGERESAFGPNDAIESVNRPIAAFNDILLVYVIRSAGGVYSAVIPKSGRSALDNIGRNLAFPGRAMSCLLQGKWRASGDECARFLVNTTLGVAGAYDAASEWFGIKGANEDFGQAFASWGIGHGVYLVLPVAGPTTARDGVGKIFDYAFDIKTWIPVPGVQAFFFLNDSSLSLDEYMALRESSLDLYATVKAYWYTARKAQVAY